MLASAGGWRRRVQTGHVFGVHQRGERREEPAFHAHEQQHHGQHAKKLDDAADEIAHRHGEVTAHDEIDAGQRGEKDEGLVILQPERSLEQVAQAHINRRRVRHEEHEDNHRRDDLERRAVVSGAEKFGHGERVEPRRHFARASGEDEPGEEGADEGVADDNPHRLDAEAPAEPSGVADEEHGGEIGGAVGERAHPRSERATAEEEIADVLGALHAPVTDGEHDEDIENDERDVDHGAHRIRGITQDLTAAKQADWRVKQRVFGNQNMWIRKDNL